MARRLLHSLRLPLHPSSFSPGGSSRWTNRDLDPVPRGNRKWGPWNFVAYWICDAMDIGTWQTASGILAVGLGWKDSLAIVAVSYFVISVRRVPLSRFNAARLSFCGPVLPKTCSD